MGETSDRDLVERWRGGDEAAKETLLSRHYPAIERFFAGKLPAAASDLTQQTFLACLEAADRLDNAASFRAFLFGVARYVLLRYLRAEGQRAPGRRRVGHGSLRGRALRLSRSNAAEKTRGRTPR